MKLSWVLFVALRYFKTKRQNRGLGPSILSVLGIAVGVMTLISVIAVMNGFQLGFIDDILEIRSYHIRLTAGPEGLDEETIGRIKGLKGVAAVLPFMEIQSLLKSDYTNFEGVLLRGVPANAVELDPSLIRQLDLKKGEFNLAGSGSVLLGYELAHALGVGPGDQVSSLSLAGASFKSLKPDAFAFTVTGIFKSGYYEFDRNLAFISLEDARSIAGTGESLVYGIKLKNRYNDRTEMQLISRLLEDSPRELVSWRHYNRSFFGALRMEKLAMMILVGLIFIVVGANIYHALKRTVVERAEEIGVLKSLGASSRAVQTVFLLDGVLIGLTGGFLGLLAGLFLSVNINQVFALAEIIINFGLRFAEKLFLPFAAAGAEGFSIFSSAYYYLTDIPSRLLFPEVLLIFLFAFLSSAGAAFFASRTVTGIRPAEVLRYEQQ